MADSSPVRRERDEDQVEADLAATRDRLTSAVSALVDRVHPQRIKQREVAGAKRLAHVELENLRLLLFNAAGDLRTDRLAKAGAGAAGFLSLLLVLRRLVGRGSRRRRGASARSSRPSRASRRASSKAAAPAAPSPSAPSAPSPSAPSTGARSGRGRRRSSAAASDRGGVAAPAPVDDVTERVRRARRKA